MREIRKGREPKSLIRHRKTAHADYDNYLFKDELRAALEAEQGGICCYCMQRIRTTPEGMKIEHWHCQSLFPGERLRYGNLLGACRGNEGEPWEEQHCDTRKGDASLKRNPADRRHKVENFIHFLGNGRIESPDEDFDAEINEVLNLNHPLLVNNRKAALDAFLISLQGLGNLSRLRWQQMLGGWDGTSAGPLRPYAGVIASWIRKKLDRI